MDIFWNHTLFKMSVEEFRVLVHGKRKMQLPNFSQIERVSAWKSRALAYSRLVGARFPLDL